MQVQNFSAAPQNEDWEHTLLPVWTLTYTHRGKTYCYTVNGQNGKICGKVPLSGKKLLALFFGIWAGLFALCLLGGWLL